MTVWDLGVDSASAETDFPVEIRPAANAAPSFEVQDETGPSVDDEAGQDDPDRHSGQHSCEPVGE